MSVYQTSDAAFKQDVLEATQLVLVDFWAEWCTPCQTIAPILDELHQEIGHQVKITKMNIDQNPNTPAQHGIRSVPTLTLFKDGKAIATKIGVLQKSKLMEWIQSYL